MSNGLKNILIGVLAVSTAALYAHVKHVEGYVKGVMNTLAAQEEQSNKENESNKGSLKD